MKITEKMTVSVTPSKSKSRPWNVVLTASHNKVVYAKCSSEKEARHQASELKSYQNYLT